MREKAYLRVDQWPPRDNSHRVGNIPNWKYKVLKAPVETLAKVLFHPRYTGIENLEKLETEACIIVSNHDTGLDPAYISMKYKYYIHTLALDNPWWNSKMVLWALKELGVIAVPPKGSSEKSFASACNLLKSNCTVLLFPEANFMHDKRAIYGKSGFVRMAVYSGRPILPVGISGIDHHHFNDFLPPLNRRIKISFGEPIVVKEGFRMKYNRRIPNEVITGIRDEVMYEVRRLSQYAGLRKEAMEELMDYYTNLEQSVYTENYL